MRKNSVIATFLGFISAVIMVLVLKELKTIFIPLIFAILLTTILSPTIRFLSKYKIPRVVSITIAVLTVFFIVYLLGLVIYANFANFVQEFPKYENSLKKTFETTLNGLNMQMDEFQDYFSKVKWQQQLEKFSFGSRVSATLGTFLTFLGYLILVLTFTVFMLTGQFDIEEKIKQAFESERAIIATEVAADIQSKVRNYLVIKIFISAATAISGVVFIMIFGIDFVVVSGVLLFVLNFIPSIGSIIASAFPILICFVQYGYSWKVPGIALSLIAIQTVFGNFLEPLMMGRGLNLSPLVVILSLIFWGWVWGVVGMVLAIPLTSSLVIVCENIEPLRIVAIILSGKKSVLESVQKS